MNYMHEDFSLQIVPRTLSPNVKWLWREADPASSTQVQVVCCVVYQHSRIRLHCVNKENFTSLCMPLHVSSKSYGLRNKAKGIDQTRLIITSSVHCATAVENTACLPEWGNCANVWSQVLLYSLLRPRLFFSHTFSWPLTYTDEKVCRH